MKLTLQKQEIKVIQTGSKGNQDKKLRVHKHEISAKKQELKATQTGNEEKVKATQEGSKEYLDRK